MQRVLVVLVLSVLLAGCVQNTRSSGLAPATQNISTLLTPTFSFNVGAETPSATVTATAPANTLLPTETPVVPTVNETQNTTLNATPTANATASPNAPTVNCTLELQKEGYPIFVAENVTEEQCGAKVGDAMFTVNTCYTTCLSGRYLEFPVPSGVYTCCGAQENTFFNRTACADCGNSSTCPEPYEPDYACAYPS